MGRSRRRGTILVVDDEVEFHMLIQAIFSHTHDVDGATTVEHALQILKQKQRYIDVILLDIRLPGRDGWDLMRILSKRRDMPPIIVITADKKQQYIVQAERLGATYTLFKPIVPSQLRKLVMML